MGEYCGCQAVTAIDELAREPDQAAALESEHRWRAPAVAGPAGGDARRLAQSMLKEQDGVFPAALTSCRARPPASQ